ncbi:MAG: Dam family site-specific DNA-(adenine-N6)-methyltransferase [Verrucomicrobiota bacterium]
MRPFLRWAGGKRWLSNTGKIKFPDSRRYVEPFLGGGSIFFAQNSNRALLSDLNEFLINAYSWMKLSPEKLYELTQYHFSEHSSDHYYAVRSQLGTSTINDAAAFIYLNRSCFNGLFRVNLAGRFNVPIGTKAFVLSEVEEFHGWARHLQNAEIVRCDFEQVINRCGENDVLFVDPPHTVAHNSNGFIEYNEKIFSWDDQVRLADSLARAKARGANFLLTNADHDSVRDLYPHEILSSETRGSEMAGRSSYRGKTTELIVASSPDLICASGSKLL